MLSRQSPTGQQQWSSMDCCEEMVKWPQLLMTIDTTGVVRDSGHDTWSRRLSLVSQTVAVLFSIAGKSFWCVHCTHQHCFTFITDQKLQKHYNNNYCYDNLTVLPGYFNTEANQYYNVDPKKERQLQ